ncbi:MAG TPA: Hsp20/alpha crystallin family protein [Isosphaeraceae bacterium]|jgi:HSP20 family protein
MASDRWDHFRDVVSLRDAVNSLLQESFVRPGGGVASAEGGPARLPLDIAETQNEFIVQASLPGIKPEDVQITIHGDTLMIRAESQAEPEKPGQTWHVRERRVGTVQRSVSLATPIRSDKAQATFEHGVLTLTLPKAEEAKPRQIKIGGASGAQGRPA